MKGIDKDGKSFEHRFKGQIFIIFLFALLLFVFAYSLKCFWLIRKDSGGWISFEPESSMEFQLYYPVSKTYDTEVTFSDYPNIMVQSKSDSVIYMSSVERIIMKRSDYKDYFELSKGFNNCQMYWLRDSSLFVYYCIDSNFVNVVTRNFEGDYLVTSGIAMWKPNAIGLIIANKLRNGEKQYKVIHR